MERFFRITTNVIFFLQVLLLFLLVAQDRIVLPPWLQVAGRMHPLILHLPIGMLILAVGLIVLDKSFRKTSAQQGSEPASTVSLYTRSVLHFTLLFVSLSASLSALFGVFLSMQGDYGGDDLSMHRNAGVALSWLCYALVLVHQSKLKRGVFMGVGAASLVVLIVAGHSGAILTHGENFLFEPISGKPVLTADNASVYAYAIEPILERKCFSCHNPSKAKGKLIMTDPVKFAAGGENGSPWVVGNPEESRMIRSFYLPLDHDEHMPPDGKPQLTSLEIQALKTWIHSGADFEKKLAELPEHDSLRTVVASLEASRPVEPTQPVYAFTGASESAIEKVNTPFVTVAPVYHGSPALQADFYVRKGFDLKSLEALRSVKDQLVAISLSRMPVSDKDLSVLSGFTNVETLNLNFTDIDGSGLDQLASLKQLKSLSLAGTKVTAQRLAPVLRHPDLSSIFLWHTPVTTAQGDSLMKAHPSVSIVLTQFHDESVMRLNRPMLDSDGILAPGSDVSFKHPMRGVSIRYTLDGSPPDSVAGILYEKPFTLEKTTVVKAVACKEGWYCSDPVEQILFVEGIRPVEAKLLTPPDPAYPGEGAKSLSDGRKGIADVLKEPSWLGYQKRPFEASFRFDDGNAPKRDVVISFGRSIYAHAFPPQSIEVWAGANDQSLKLLRKVDVAQPANYVPVKVDQVAIPLGDEAYPLIRLVINPLPKLPTWFSKKGEKGWFFVDEVFFY